MIQESSRLIAGECQLLQLDKGSQFQDGTIPQIVQLPVPLPHNGKK
ncbi:hypothetical protein IQ269_06355 [Tychonema sp. LEGE 07199]|nr:MULTISPECIES: hypothetical protein [unclassified Tychonema]MBE9120440.1 hypothetical protein [Tychonema sp. LEGE 07199]MBE9131733.1 hypothetical protein [Tychonema sp. LEGE 07196]